MGDAQQNLKQPYFGGDFPDAQLSVPGTLGAWQRQRGHVRATLEECLGDIPPRPEPVRVETVSSEAREGYTLETLAIGNGAGVRIPAYLLVPDGRTEPGPAILYNHYHGGLYDLGKEELFKEDWPIPGTTFARELTSRGYVVLCIDSYVFGERRWHGPAGESEEGSATEWSLFKLFLWQGRTMWGMMVRDDRIALDVLCSRPEVDPSRIGAIGMSMGSTRTWWLSAMDERVKVSACVACLTHYQTLIRHGMVRAHGFYYFVPDVLKHFDSEAVLSLIAPRPLITLTGSEDGGSPAAGVRIINETCEQVYGLHGEAQKFRGLLYEGVGHDYTPQIWREASDWFERWL